MGETHCLSCHPLRRSKVVIIAPRDEREIWPKRSMPHRDIGLTAEVTQLWDEPSVTASFVCRFS